MPKHGLPIFLHSSWKEASQGWLRDDERTNTTILSYLKSENEYTNAITSHLTELQDTLYNEMLSSIIETDYSVPRPDLDCTILGALRGRVMIIITEHQDRISQNQHLVK